MVGGESDIAIPGNANAVVERAIRLVDFRDFNSSARNGVNYSRNHLQLQYRLLKKLPY